MCVRYFFLARRWQFANLLFTKNCESEYITQMKTCTRTVCRLFHSIIILLLLLNDIFLFFIGNIVKATEKSINSTGSKQKLVFSVLSLIVLCFFCTIFLNLSFNCSFLFFFFLQCLPSSKKRLSCSDCVLYGICFQ